MEPITLTTPRLLLRTVGPDDTEAVYAACQDPEIQRWTTVPSPYLPEHATGFVEQLAPDGWRDNTMFTFGVFRTDGRPRPVLVAMTGLTRRTDATGEIGFWTAKEHRGLGYVPEAVGAIARWAFAEAGFGRLEWRAEIGNTASRAAALKAGFTLEGTRRAALLAHGTLRDCWSAALLPSDLTLPSAFPHLPAPFSPAAPSGPAGA